MMIRFKRKIYHLLEGVAEHSRLEKILSYFMVLLILLNAFAVIIETVEWIDRNYFTYLFVFEIFSVIIFTIDYFTRIWTITINEKYKNMVLGRIKYFFTPMAIIDLLSILPFYLFAVFPFDLRFLRLFRLFRFIRILKLGRYSTSLKLLGNVFRAKRTELVITVFIIFFVIVLASCFIYIVEHDAQPDKYTNIPVSIYWSVITITSVGYGDMYPITPLGQFIAVIVALLGLGIFAIPTGIIASGFYEQLHNQKKQCPHCGKEIN